MENRGLEEQQRPYTEERMGIGPGPILEAAQGGRIGFKGGTKFNPSKRTFLKGAGAGLGVLSMLPFVGKFFKPAAKAVSKAAKVTKDIYGQPDYISDLIAVVQAKGKKSIEPGFKKSDFGTKHTYKNVEVTEDVGGNIRIKKEVEGGGQYTTESGDVDTWDGVVRELDIEIHKGGSSIKDEGLETAKITKEPDVYFEGTVTPDMDGKMKDIVEYIDDVDHLELKKIADESKDLMIKKASGGRVPLAGGKKAGRPKGKRFSYGKQQSWLLDPEWDDMNPDDWLHILKLLRAGEIGGAEGGRVPLAGGGGLRKLIKKALAKLRNMSAEDIFDAQGKVKGFKKPEDYIMDVGWKAGKYYKKNPEKGLEHATAVATGVLAARQLDKRKKKVSGGLAGMLGE
jgi:hypothetical protein